MKIRAFGGSSLVDAIVSIASKKDGAVLSDAMETIASTGRRACGLTLMLFAFAPLAVLAGTLGEGLNCPSLEWTTGGTPSRTDENVNWSYCSDDSYSDGACVVSGAGGAGDAMSWIKATVAGPCKISFRYKVQTYNGTFKVMDGSTTLYEYTGVTGTSPSWQYKEFDLADGSHEIKLQYRHPGMGYAYQFNGVKVDEFTVTANATLASALDAADLTFTTGGNADWFPQTSVTHDGEDAVRSGAISGSQSTWIQTTVTGPKQIRFWWKTSSEANYDILRFYVDGTEKASVSGTTDWSQQTVQVTGTGTHTLKWQYSKDGSVDSGDDCGWVDQLVITDAPSGEAQTYYVNGATGNDSNTGLSASAAKKTIQAAIDAAADGSTILVAAGTYAPINTQRKVLTIKGTSGALHTIIDGGGTARCAVLGERNYTRNAVLIGFTLQNGKDSASGDYADGAAASAGTIENCIVRNCVAVRSIVFANTAKNCLLYGNNASGAYAVIMHGETFNCTIVNNSGRAAWDCGFYNTIANGGIYTSSGQDICYYHCCLDSLIRADRGNFISEPKFVDADNGDYRLASDSPCIDAGTNSFVTSTTDLAGNLRIANGIVDVGCYEFGSYSGQLTYYVNGTTGDNSNSGLSASAAKKTIQAAIDVALTGSKISVAAGTYEPIVTSNKNVRIESESGAASTVINGNGMTICARLSLEPRPYTNTVLRGFTLTNGRGGVEGGTIENCIIRNNGSWVKSEKAVA